jgi:hypothetical protein
MQMDMRAALALLTCGLLAACDPAALTGGSSPLDSQPGPRSTTWHLLSVQVDGAHVLVRFRAASAPGRRESVWIEGEAASLVDDAAAIRYPLLLGSDGRLLGTAADRQALRIDVEGDTDIWMKFAAPPEATRTVSIALPRIGTFDAVPLDR